MIRQTNGAMFKLISIDANGMAIGQACDGRVYFEFGTYTIVIAE